MGIKVALEHRTSYTFDRLVEVYPHVVRLRPAPHSRTPIEAYSLQVEPADHFINWQQDPFGNFLARLVFPNRAPQPDHHGRPGRRHDGDQPVRLLHRGLRRARSASTTPRTLADDLEPYLRPVDEAGEGSGPGDLVQAWLQELRRRPRHAHHRLPGRSSTARCNADVGYSVRMEPGVQTPDDTLRTGDRLLPRLGVAAGVDAAPARPGRPVRVRLPGAADLRRRGARRAVRARRRLHRPARLGRGVHPGRRLDRPRPDVGPVRRRGPHPAVGHAASASRRPPITGATEPCETTLEFSNVVRRIHEDPRVTLPYTEAAVGRDQRARRPRRRAAGRRRRPAHDGRRADVRLDRQPGRPGVDHRRRRAAQARAGVGVWPRGCSSMWAPSGVVHRGQGKWYPGEPLPRWQIGLHWRTDGEPLWSDHGAARRPVAGRARRTDRRCAPDAGAASCSAPSPTASGCRPPRCGPPTRTR